MELWAWGANNYGQLGIGITNEQCGNPVQVHLSLVVGTTKAMSTGGGHSLIINDDGQLFSCGWNTKGQLGLGLDFQNVDSFTRVPLPEGVLVQSVSCGWDFSIFVSGDQRVFGCGSNGFGQLGRPLKDSKQFNCFEEIGALKDKQIVKVSCGMRHSVFLTIDGNVYVCGASKRGQLGLGHVTTPIVDTPALIENIPVVTDICAGQNFTVLLDSTKTQLIVFGDNKFGQLGFVNIDGESAATVSVPKMFPVNQVVKVIDCGWTHTLLMTAENELWTAGRNNYGQLGRLQDSNSGFGRVENLSLVSKVSSGYEHVLTVTGNGQLMSWGWNEHGNLGTGHTQNSQLPAVVKIADRAVLDCFAGSGHSFAFVVKKI